MRAGAIRGAAHRTRVDPSFVALDFELANGSHASICSAGVARVDRGRIVTTRHYLCRPPHPYSFVNDFNTNLTGLDAGRLAGQRPFVDLADILLRNIGDSVVVGHAVGQADLSMFDQSWHASGLGPSPDWRYVCTLQVSRAVFPQLPKHRLNDMIAAVFDEPLPGHHSADVDAAASARLLLALLDLSGTTLEDWVQTRRGTRNRVLKRPRHSYHDTPIPERPSGAGTPRVA